MANLDMSVDCHSPKHSQGLFRLLSLSRHITGSRGGTVFPWTVPFLEFRGSLLWTGSTDVSEDARRVSRAGILSVK